MTCALSYFHIFFGFKLLSFVRLSPCVSFIFKALQLFIHSTIYDSFFWFPIVYDKWNQLFKKSLIYKFNKAIMYPCKWTDTCKIYVLFRMYLRDQKHLLVFENGLPCNTYKSSVILSVYVLFSEFIQDQISYQHWNGRSHHFNNVFLSKTNKQAYNFNLNDYITC